MVTTQNKIAMLVGAGAVENAIHAAAQNEKAENIFDQSGMKYLALKDRYVGNQL